MEEQIKALAAGDGNKQAEEEQAAKLSIQARAESQPVVDSAPAIWWFTAAAEGEIADWWCERRDRDLRDFVKQPGNDILAGAVSSMVKKFRAMNWVLEGPERIVKKYQKLLSEAEFGKGWTTLLSKTIEDYLTADKGAFWEIIGAGKPDGPLTGPVVGIAHLDSAQCALTGDLTYPVLFRDPKDGKTHKLHTTRVVHLVDMESPIQGMNGIGFCAVSRVVAASQVLLKLAQYKNEKLSDLPEAGLLILSNIPKHQYDDARAMYQRERRRLGEELWAPVMTLFSLDPTQKATADFVSFASLPDAFNERESTDIYVNVVALAFGVDVREFWPMSAGPLGTATETLVQHQKARGKGIGDLVGTIERALNWAVLPGGVSFRFDFQNDDEDEQTARITDSKAKTIIMLWAQGQDPAGGDPVVSREEVRQMLADEVSYFNPEWLSPMEEDEEGEATDTEREEKSSRDGPTVKVNRYGKYLAVAAKAKDAKAKKGKEKEGLKYSPDQPREPAGGPGGGQWTATGLGYIQHNGPKLEQGNLRDEDYARYQKAMALDSQEAKEMLERAGSTREEALREIDEARALAGATPQTRTLHIGPDGNYTSERQALHDILSVISGKVDKKQAELLKPRGRPLKPVTEVIITDDDIDAAIAEWDTDVPEAAGLLRAISG